MKIVEAVERMMIREHLNLNIASTRVGVHPQNMSNWRNNKDVLSDSRVKNHLSLHKGPSSIVDDIKGKCIEYVQHWREKGFPVTRMCLVCKVCKLNPEFLEKTLEARKIAISHFLTKNNFTHHVATHKAQRAPGEVHGKSLTHLEVPIPRVNHAC